MADDRTNIERGLNTEVEHGGRHYHVQTQSSQRGAPAIESMVFHRGQTLVRITSSYEDVATRLGFNGDDAQHLVELQHADLIRKVRHGMLADDEEAYEEPSLDEPRLIDADGGVVDVNEVEDASVRELLRELGVKIEERRSAAKPEPEPVEAEPAGPSRRRGWALRIRLPF